MPPNLFAYCPQALYGDGCTDSTCPLVHDAKYCRPCAMICHTASSYIKHINGPSHIKKAAGTHWLVCSICNVSTSSSVVWSAHVAGHPHKRLATRLGIDPDTVQPILSQSGPFPMKHCGVCDLSLPAHAWESHTSGRRHSVQRQHVEFKTAFERATEDRGGISVSQAREGLDFGVLNLVEATNGVQIDILISSKCSTPVTIVSASVHSAIRIKSVNKITPFSVKISPGCVVAPGGIVNIPVRFQRTSRGRYDEQLVVTFQRTRGNPFVIVRRLRAIVGDATDHEALKPVTSYVRRRRAQWHNNLPTVSGERPPSLVAAKYVKKLPDARIPSALAELLKKGTPEEIATRVRENYFCTPLTITQHQSHFAHLLWIEESRMVEDLRRYDMVDVSFTTEGRHYLLEVPGLAEKRPSVMIGDTIMVQAADGSEQKTHRGFVHDVRLETIRVSFHGSFQAGRRRYNVCFQLNRVPLRRQHQALNASPPSPQRLLFPLRGSEALERPPGANGQRIGLFNLLLASNPAQLQAVKSILRLRAGSAPFIIFGPPGTGKTVTDIEAIRQILHRDRNARILACAPSNSAADLIALRLAEALTPQEMFRSIAPSRVPASVPEALAPYTLYLSTGNHSHYAFPEVETLEKYKVIVSTCGTASFAHSVGMARGHFTHIFVDEAGQATEPEVLTAIKTLASEETRIVLSGDPKQLGPIVRSSIAREHGLGVSYMERLMEREVYSAQHGRGTSWIKLLQNYRSHGSILRYPNEKFYDNELEVCGQHATINSFIGSPQLVSPKFPIVFHAISGHNDRESTSPSYFNIDEASEVKAYVQSLLGNRNFPVRAEDIGVITPYHAQVRKIRKLLRDANIADVTVGSVEMFQGQERRAIILSTVRSSANLLAYDAKFTLGFVSNPRRFNVAITRAQALLIVVGDAAVLSLDPIWRGFLNYIYLHGGWRGDPPNWDVNAPVRDDADYIGEMQQAVAADMNAFMASLGEGEDLEGDANIEREFPEAD